jgi:hypothetical protein
VSEKSLVPWATVGVQMRLLKNVLAVRLWGSWGLHTMEDESDLGRYVSTLDTGP